MLVRCSIVWAKTGSNTTTIRIGPFLQNPFGI